MNLMCSAVAQREFSTCLIQNKKHISCAKHKHFSEESLSTLTLFCNLCWVEDTNVGQKRFGVFFVAILLCKLKVIFHVNLIVKENLTFVK